MHEFQSLFVNSVNGEVQTKLRSIGVDDLPEGEVLIEVHYSCVNYKDALASKTGTGVIRNYPMVLGIDLSGVVVSSDSEDFQVGDKVIVTSYKLGVGHYGGYSEYARVPSEWVVPLPEGLSLKEAMIIGTAGFTAAQSIYYLEESGAKPDKGDILVQGATGGVGSFAVSILAKLNYTVATVSRKKEQAADYLTRLGAQQILHPDEIRLEPAKPLAKQRWAGVVDPVGGEQLPHLFAQVKSFGAVALSGNAGGNHFESTVLPFILRGIRLIGVDSVNCPLPLRLKLWHLLASEWKPTTLTDMVDQEIDLAGLPEAFEKILAGKMTGRTLVVIKK
ncbi:YhdH/YhfP family quinone oxidoreductase [Desemzia sp. RIT804]|uniref:YhdH/YhfP family quinone oxidoreductase n=1 Tax=Desemzia sp. RIT 804 TaxID=2810209 RepID=UPI001951B503|nr:YhdH/YhfP family quinone oxidoreductase [Desemzia sp. RIT 804]MBM6614593.1 YhdH/YhfP family quinone oxidoreductase [Desemzia sp. RIT 804]